MTIMSTRIETVKPGGVATIFPKAMALGLIEYSLDTYVFPNLDADLKVERERKIEFVADRLLCNIQSALQVRIAGVSVRPVAFKAAVRGRSPRCLASTTTRPPPRRARRGFLDEMDTTFGFELNNEDIRSAVDAMFGGVSGPVGDFIETLASAIDGIALVLAGDNLSPGDPDIPELEVLENFGLDLPAGISVIIKMTLPPPACTNVVCDVIRNIFGSPDVYFLANGGPAGVTIGVSLGSIVLARNKCNEPKLELSEVSLVAVFGKRPAIKFQLGLAVHIDRVRQESCSVTPPAERLDFFGALIVEPKGSLTLAAGMRGVWRRAFGFDFLHIANVALSVTGDSKTLIGGFEVNAAMQLGRNCYFADRDQLDASAACVGAAIYVGLDFDDPAHNFYRVELYGMTLRNIIRTFASEEDARTFEANIPAFMGDRIGFPSMGSSNVREPNPVFSFCADPDGVTTLTGVDIPGGLYFKGRFEFLGVFGQAEILLNPKVRLMVDFEMSPLSLANGQIALQRSRSNSVDGPKFFMDVTYTKPRPSILANISAYVNIFGLERELVLIVDDERLYFLTYGNIFGLFSAELEVSATYAGTLAEMGFSARGEIKQNFIRRVQETIQRVLTQARDEADRQLRAAEAALQAEDDKLENAKHDDEEADRAVAQLNAKAKELTAGLRKAAEEQASSDKIWREKQQLSREKDAAFDRAQQALSNAQGELQSARGSLADAENDVNQACRRRLRHDLASPPGLVAPTAGAMEHRRQRRWSCCSCCSGWVSAITNVVEVVVEVIVESACAIAKRVALAALAGLQGALWVAERALDVAKGALEVARLAAEAAITVMKAAELVARKAVAAAATALDFVVQNDLILKGWEAAKSVRNAALTVAQGLVRAARLVVSAVRITVKAGLDAASWLVGNLVPVDIRRVSFSLNLSAARIASSGFELSLDVSILNGAPQTFTLSVNLNDLWQLALTLAEEAFDGITDLL